MARDRAAHCLGCLSHSRVLPSMSVNRKVGVPARGANAVPADLRSVAFPDASERMQRDVARHCVAINEKRVEALDVVVAWPKMTRG
jgi:hypothetical protein